MAHITTEKKTTVKLSITDIYNLITKEQCLPDGWDKKPHKVHLVIDNVATSLSIEVTHPEGHN